MRSLRGRLVAILLYVACAGLVVLAVVTFAEQRSFLYVRLDKQVQTGFAAAVSGLRIAEQTGNANCVQGVRHDVDGDAIGKGPIGGNHSEAEQSRWPNLPANGSSSGTFVLPSGSYGAIIGPTGNVVADCVFGYRDAENLRLPNFNLDQLSTTPRTVVSQGADAGRFRAAELNPSASRYRVVVAIPLAETQQTLDRLVLVEVTVIVLMLALLGFASWLLVGIGLRPLDRIGETAAAIAGGDLTRRIEPADPRTEIGRLGIALNRMLQGLERAFKERTGSEDRLRQFLADASHELRTPLVSIRGYAELYRLGATPDEAEVRQSMERIEQEAERMGLLVEDMLTLARLDETQQRDFHEVDLEEIVADAVRDAEVAAPRRAFTFDSDDRCSVLGDAYQLQQVIANLLNNAIAHTPDGTPVEVTLRREGDNVRLDVRDHGPGLPPGAGDQIFERFWRAEGGRERGKAGSGLGLPIVHGIVAAHGGRVHAADADASVGAAAGGGRGGGGGAIFSVWLPLLR